MLLILIGFRYGGGPALKRTFIKDIKGNCRGDTFLICVEVEICCGLFLFSQVVLPDDGAAKKKDKSRENKPEKTTKHFHLSKTTKLSELAHLIHDCLFSPSPLAPPSPYSPSIVCLSSDKVSFPSPYFSLWAEREQGDEETDEEEDEVTEEIECVVEDTNEGDSIEEREHKRRKVEAGEWTGTKKQQTQKQQSQTQYQLREDGTILVLLNKDKTLGDYFFSETTRLIVTRTEPQTVNCGLVESGESLSKDEADSKEGTKKRKLSSTLAPPLGKSSSSSSFSTFLLESKPFGLCGLYNLGTTTFRSVIHWTRQYVLYEFFSSMLSHRRTVD